MPADTLTRNEKNILYNLVAYPDSSDKEISTRVNLGISTVTKIRNRLLREGCLRVVNIPSVQKLGAEILSLGYGEFNPDVSIHQKLEKGRELMNRASGSFFTLGDGNQALGIGFYRKFTEAMEAILLTKRLLCKEPMMTFGDLNPIVMSFKIAKIFRFFNYAPMLAKSFDIEDPTYDEPDYYFSSLERTHLSKKEKLVLFGLVKYPDYCDKKLSSVVGISRQTISSIRKRFKREGILTRRYIPDIVKLGFEVVVFAHVKLKNDVTPDPSSLRKGLREENIIFSLCHGTDVITLSAFSSFGKTKARITSFLKDTQKRNLFSRDPTIYLFSASDVIYQLDHFYHIPVSNILGIDREKLIVQDGY